MVRGTTRRRAVARRVALVLTAGLMVLTAACGSSGSSSQAGRVRFMYNLTPIGLFSDYYRTQARGYYDDAGVDVDLMQGKGSALTIDAVATGKIDIGDASCATTMLAVAGGRPVVSVGMRFAKPSFGFIVDRDSKYRKVSDLAGADVLLAPGTVQALLAPFIFEKAGVDMGKQVDVLGVQIAQQAAIYAQGRGDSLVTSVPFGVPIVNPDRPSRYIPWTSEGFDVPDFCYVANKDFVKKDPQAVRDFLQATYRGRVEALENEDEAVAAIRGAFPELDAKVTKGQLDLTKGLDCSGDMTRLGEHDAKAWDEGVKVMRKYAGLDSGIKASDFYTNEFIDEIETPSCT